MKGATLAVARPGVVQAARTGRDKPVPYNARAGAVREFAPRDLRADAAGHGRCYPGPPFHGLPWPCVNSSPGGSSPLTVHCRSELGSGAVFSTCRGDDRRSGLGQGQSPALTAALPGWSSPDCHHKLVQPKFRVPTPLKQPLWINCSTLLDIPDGGCPVQTGSLPFW